MWQNEDKCYVPVIGSARRQTLISERNRIEPIVSDQQEILEQVDKGDKAMSIDDAKDLVKKSCYEDYIAEHGIIRSGVFLR